MIAGKGDVACGALSVRVFGGVILGKPGALGAQRPGDARYNERRIVGHGSSGADDGAALQALCVVRLGAVDDSAYLAEGQGLGTSLCPLLLFVKTWECFRQFSQIKLLL